MSAQLKYCKDCSVVSEGTLRTEDLLRAVLFEAVAIRERNRPWLSENLSTKAVFSELIANSKACFADDDCETFTEEGEANAAEDFASLCDYISAHFCAPYVSLGFHPGDGALLGYWPDVEGAKENCAFVSSELQEYPGDGFSGEWLHVNERGNATLYLRDESGRDVELWGVV